MMSTSPVKALAVASILWCSHSALAADPAAPAALAADPAAPAAPAAPANKSSPSTLSQLLREALTHNPIVASRKASVGAAQQNVQAAKWQYFPTPGVSFGSAKASQTDPSYQGDSSVKVFHLEQPLWTGGRLTASQNLANARSAISVADLNLTRYEVARQTSEAFGSWLSNHHKTVALNVYLDALSTRLTMLERRITAGVSATSDRMFAVSRLELARVESNTLRVAQEAAISRLTQLLGRPVTDNELRGITVNVFGSTAALSDLLAQARSKHPSIARDDGRIREATAELAVAQAQLSPGVSLRLERQSGNFSHANLPSANRALINFTTSFGAGLSVFNQIEGLRGRLRAAQSELEASRREITVQITNDDNQFKSLSERTTALKAALRAAEDTVVAWDRQFTFGLKTWQDLLNAHRELQQARMAYVEAQIQAVVVGWRLAIQVHGPDDAINASLSSGL